MWKRIDAENGSPAQCSPPYAGGPGTCLGRRAIRMGSEKIAFISSSEAAVNSAHAPRPSVAVGICARRAMTQFQLWHRISERQKR